ncbi:hypothetical protein GWK47_047853 [Chionoecetes opilio]|uniref:Uncharacterized protein n=1 Tax=Chionoecetes opilio TaxID=41210 RepID=A0A8J4YCH9_CHIOP|nr:hypothetical protein GWK47_047853 [Chionoecetes opilio]
MNLVRNKQSGVQASLLRVEYAKICWQSFPSVLFIPLRDISEHGRLSRPIPAILTIPTIGIGCFGENEIVPKVLSDVDVDVAELLQMGPAPTSITMTMICGASTGTWKLQGGLKRQQVIRDYF